MAKSMRRIHNVTIERMVDKSPDTSWLGEYSKRMEQLNAGDWCFIGIRAKAEVTLADPVTQTVSSGGLWGIESDSDRAYFESIEQEELAELSNQLHAAGFSKRAIAAAFKNVERKES